MPERLSAAIVLRSRANPSGHHREWFGHMCDGFKRHGISVDTVEVHTMPSVDFVVCWGLRNGALYIEHGIPTLIMERGYVGDRFAWTSLGWNGLNGRANFCNQNVDGDRWDRLFPKALSLWRYDGQYILLVGQVAGDTAVRDVDLRRWYNKTADALYERYDMPVFFRPHPQSPDDRVHGVPKLYGTLEDALAGAALVVTFNSNVGVLSVLAGVPVVAMDQGSMAWAVAGHDVDQVRRLDRTKWAHRLAYSQWSAEEIASGEAWAHLRSGVTRDAQRV